MLAGPGAEQFAVEQGLALCDPADLITPAQYANWRRGYAHGDEGDDAHRNGSGGAAASAGERRLVGAGLSGTEDMEDDDHKHDTVGAVAVDASGHVAAATSTGGIAAKHPGRIGDTPLVGCGFYAEDGLGGVSTTGHGEDFIRLLLARRATEYLERGLSAQAAASAAIKLLGERVHGLGGLILLDGHGRVGYARNTLPRLEFEFTRNHCFPLGSHNR